MSRRNLPADVLTRINPARTGLRKALVAPVAIVLALWVASVLTVIVVGLWAAPVTGYWQPAAMGVGLGGVQLVLAGLVMRRVRRSHGPIFTWSTVALVAFCVPLIVMNIPAIFLPLSRILHS